MKVDFIDEEHLVIYCFYDEKLRTEEELKVFFKLLNELLKKRYDYEFHGLYNVDVYNKGNLFILSFGLMDDFIRKDFDITLYVNSILLFEFDDIEFYSGNKIFYNNKYYIELDDVVDDIRLFEFGNIIFGDKVEDILNSGKLISI